MSRERMITDMITLYNLGYTIGDIAEVFYMTAQGVYYCLRDKIDFRPHVHSAKMFAHERRQNALWIRDHYNRNEGD